MLRKIARKVLPFRIREALRRWISRGAPASVPASYGYQIIESDVPGELSNGWKELAVAERQQVAFAPLLRQMYKGNPREDFIAVAAAVQMANLEDPLIIEVGCGSGWNSEVLAHLLKRPVRYVGLDYSAAMTGIGKRCYPGAEFVIGDATALPFHDGACDILLSGTVLMHIVDYRKAVEESRRVTQKWCILHTVPVVHMGTTKILRKFAYGSPVPEVIFNEKELLELVNKNNMRVRRVFDNYSYDLSDILGEPTENRTYLCEIV